MSLVIALVWTLAAWITLIAALTVLFFFYENLNTYGVEEMRRRTGHSPWGQLLRLSGLTWLSNAVVALTYPLGWIPPLWFRPPAVATRQPGGLRHGSPTQRPPVLLVHGLYHNASAWVLFRQRLRSAGFEHVFAYSYSSLFNNYYQLTAKLANRVEQVRAHFPSTRIVLVGHSLGGLQVRGYMASEHSRDKIAAAVTLGAPNQGSKLAALGAGALARSLAYHGQLAQELEAADQPASAPCLALTASLDEFVLPLSAANLPRAQELGWTEQLVMNTSHIFMLYDNQVADAALAFLDQTLTGA